MKKKVVFFDIDGTLLDSDFRMSDSTHETLLRLKKNGVLIFVCTGRAKCNLMHENLLEIGFDGYIASCGNHVEIKGEKIFERIIPPEYVQRTVELMKEYDIPTLFEGPEKMWITKWGFENNAFVNRVSNLLGRKAVFIDSYQEDMYINKFSMDILGDTQYMKVKDDLKECFCFIENFFPTSAKSIPDKKKLIGVVEAGLKEMDKCLGIQMVCEHLDIAQRDTFAVGDGVNDMNMLSFVGTGIAMGNAAKCVQEMADYVTTDIHNDGIYNAMLRFSLI